MPLGVRHTRPRGAGEDDRTRQAREQGQQFDMIPLRVVVAVTPRRGAGGHQVRRVDVDQLPVGEEVRGQELVGQPRIFSTG